MNNNKIKNKNKTQMKKYLSLLAVTLTLVACNNENETLVEYGHISLGLENSKEITVSSRASSAEELANFNINILQGSVSKWAGKYNELQNVELVYPVGDNYLVTAESCTLAEAQSANSNWGEMRTAGQSTPFSITSGATTQVNFSCTMQNAKVGFSYDQSFKDVFTDYSVEVYESSESNRTLVFDSNATFETKAAYFNIDADPQISYTVKGLFNGVQKTYPGTLVIAAAKWHRLTVKATANGQINLGITIDNSVQEDNQNVEVNPYQ